MKQYYKAWNCGGKSHDLQSLYWALVSQQCALWNKAIYIRISISHSGQCKLTVFNSNYHTLFIRQLLTMCRYGNPLNNWLCYCIMIWSKIYDCLKWNKKKVLHPY